jgi:hypothetical protein
MNSDLYVSVRVGGKDNFFGLIYNWPLDFFFFFFHLHPPFLTSPLTNSKRLAINLEQTPLSLLGFE